MKNKITSLITAACFTVCSVFTPIIGGLTGSAADPQSGDAHIENDIEVVGENSLGDLIAGELAPVYEDHNSGCCIMSVEMDGKVASVSFTSAFDCSVVVGIYDEDGVRLLGTGSCTAAASDTSAKIEINIGEMPEFYDVKAYLIRTSDMAPLCRVFDDPTHTNKMQDFLAKTTEDFPAERVINFDDDITKNFAVFAEKTHIIPASEGVNVLTSADDENKAYVFENIDESISSLRGGDIFAFSRDGDVPLIVKVDVMTVTGKKAVIRGMETSIEEVFEHFELESSADAGSAEIDDSSLEEGINFLGVSRPAPIAGLPRKTASGDKKAGEIENEINIEWDEGFEISDKLSLKFDMEEFKREGDLNHDGLLSGEVTINGGIDLSIELGVKIYIGSDVPKYFEVKFDVEAGINITITDQIEVSISLIPIFWSIGGCVKIKITPALVVRMSGTVEVCGKLTATLGFRASAAGIESISTNPKFSAGIKSTGEYFIGVALQPEVTLVCEWFADVEADAEGGVKITTEAESEVSGELLDESSPDERHDCTGCIKGSTAAVTEITVKGKLFGQSAEIKLVSIEIPLDNFDFYISQSHGFEFGFGECPYKSYRVKIKVTDSVNGLNVRGASLVAKNKFTKPNSEVVDYTSIAETDDSGVAQLWLHSGPVSYTVSHPNYEDGEGRFYGRVRKVEANGESENCYCINGEITNDYSVEMEPRRYTVAVTVKDTDGEPVSDARIRTSYSGTRGDNIRTDSDGKCSIRLPKGLWSVSAERFGYEDASVTVNVRENNEPAANIVMKKDMGQSRITVKNQFGKGITGAAVKIEQEDSSDPYIGATARNGIFSTKLEAGEHKITISKAGFETVTDDVTVEDGVPVDLEYTINGEYKNVKLKVTDTDGDPLSDVTVTGAALAKESYKTGSDGTVKVGILTGSHTLRFKKSGSKAVSCTVSIESGSGVVEVVLSGGDTAVKDVIIASGSYGMILTDNGCLYKAEPQRIGVTEDGRRQRYITNWKKVMDNVETALTTAFTHAAITDNGDLYVWGNNSSAMIGDGTMEDSSQPIKIMENVKQVAFNTSNTYALTNDGELYAWGCNSGRGMGNDLPRWNPDYSEAFYKTPVRIMTNVKKVYAGNYCAAAIDANDDLYMWGQNQMGMIGNGDWGCIPNSVTKAVTSPYKVLDNVADVKIESYVVSAVTKDKVLYMWGGIGGSSFMGVDSVLSQEAGQQVYPQPVKVAEDVTDFNYRSYLTSDGIVHQLEKDKVTEAVEAVTIFEGAGSIGSNYAITPDGCLYMWGNNDYGSVGNGDAGTRDHYNLKVTEPFCVMDNVKKARYDSLSYAITEDGELYMWGRDTFYLIPEGAYEVNYLSNRSCPIPSLVLMPDDSGSTAPAPSGLPSLKTADGSSDEITMTFRDLIPGQYYNYYAMRQRGGNDPFSANNLLYINQYQADENGVITFSYPPPTTLYVAFVVCNVYAVCEHSYEDGYCTKCRLAEPAAPTPSTKISFGDVNCDGKVDAADASLVLEEYARLSTGAEGAFTGDVKDAADVNKDDKIDAADASLILAYYAYVSTGGGQLTMLEWMNNAK